MQLLPLSFYSDFPAHVPLKVSLFARIYELQGLITHLDQVLQLSASKQQAWIKEHETTVKEVMQTLARQFNLEIGRNDLDQDLVRLLTEYSRYLQELGTILQTLFNSKASKNLHS